MKFQKRNRLAVKIQMKCFECRQDCLPKNGDWHNGADNQVFLCHSCKPSLQLGRPKMVKTLLSSSLQA